MARNNTQNKILKNSIYNFVYQFVAIAAPLVTIPYLSRILGSENIGIYSYTESIVEYFMMFATLGIHGYGAREVAFNQKDRMELSRIFARLQSLKLIMVIISVTGYMIMVFARSTAIPLKLALGISIICTFFDITWFYRGIEDFKTIAIRNILIKLVSIALIFLLVRSRGDLLIYVMIQVLITLLGNLTLWLRLSSIVVFRDIGKIQLFKDFRVIIELFIPVIAVRVYGVLDKSMLGFLVHDMKQSGYYEQVSKISGALLTIITSVTTVIMPNVAARYAEGNTDRIHWISIKTFQFVFSISCAVCLGLIAIADRFVPAFLGDEFAGAVLLMRLYAVVILIVPLSNVAANTVLTPIKRHNKGTLAVVLGALTNVCLNLLLMKHYKALGATIATIVAEIVVTYVHLYYARDYVPITKLFKSILGYFVKGIVMCVTVILFGLILSKKIHISDRYVLIVQIMIGSISYLFMLLFIKRDEMTNLIVERIGITIRGRNINGKT